MVHLSVVVVVVAVDATKTPSFFFSKRLFV